MERRQFMKRAASAAATTGAVAASSIPAPAISQGLMKWRMQTTWPKNFPGLGTGANKLAEYIGAASSGKLTVEVFGGGEIVPAFETMDAVSRGTIEMGRVLDYTDHGDEERKLCSLYLSLMDRMGLQLDRFGDADRRLAEL